MMEKKEYKAPKMEIVDAAPLGNLLQGSGDNDSFIDVEIEDENS